MSSRKLKESEISRRLEQDQDTVEKVKRFYSGRISITFEAKHATEDIEIAHELDAIPDDMVVGTPTADVRIWRGTTEWTREYIYLRSSAACTVNILPIVRR